MNFIVCAKQGPHANILVVTDADLIGKVIEEGKLQLDLTKKFYQGEEKTKDKVKVMLSTCSHLHLTGKGAVAIGVEMELVNSDKILYVNGVPHAQVIVEN
tara:strand:- start:493 stop:792 length:300 start_codon:yes stop_codon:yes gene_type:complete